MPSLSSSDFQTQSNELNQRYTIIIDEVVKTYPSHKANTIINSQEDAYKQNINNLQKLQEEFFILKNSLNKDTDVLQKNIKEIDEKIYILEEENKKLKAELTLLNNSDNAAHGRLTDSRTLYNQQLLGNLLIFLSFSGITYLYYRKA